MLAFNYVDDANNPLWGTAGHGFPGVTAFCRLGSALYAFGGIPGFGVSGNLYKSMDFGKTWTIVNTACPLPSFATSGFTPSIRLYVVDSDTLVVGLTFQVAGATVNNYEIEVCFYTISADMWSATHLIHDPSFLRAPFSPSMYVTVRPDKSILCSITCTTPGQADGVSIMKFASGAVTQLGSFHDPTQTEFYVQMGGVMDAAGNVGLWIAVNNASGDEDMKFCSVSAGDAVSGLQMVDPIFESQPPQLDPALNERAADVSADGEIAYAYGAHVQDSFPSLLGEVHVARATGGILAPTWTVEIVDSTNHPSIGGDRVAVAASYGGGTAANLQVLWLSSGSSAPNTPAPEFIYQASKSGGVWSTTTVFDIHAAGAMSPSVPGATATAFIASFNLLNGFPSGFGVYIRAVKDASSVTTVPPTIGYAGPKIATGYVSSGGTLASPGRFASVG